MASGILGNSDLAATTNTVIYTVPAGVISACTVNMCNRSDVEVSVRLALSVSSTPSNAEYIEYNAKLPATGGVLERTGLILSSNIRVIGYSSAPGVSINVYGIEE